MAASFVGLDDRERNAELLEHRRDVVADAWDVRDPETGGDLHVYRAQLDRCVSEQSLRANVIVFDERVASRVFAALALGDGRDHVPPVGSVPLTWNSTARIGELPATARPPGIPCGSPSPPKFPA